MTSQANQIFTLLTDVVAFADALSGIKLRSYQKEVARSICNSVVNRLGLTFVIIFPRQSGKNELQAQIETYLLTLYSKLDAEIVKVSPTWKPQTLNAMRRLERVLSRNPLSHNAYRKESGHIFRFNLARLYFLSGAPQANVVGATASTLLECDEAQDVTIAKWDKDINPMAASTNATRVFWGTAWTSHTLLAREKRLALDLEKTDGLRRLFQLTADDIRQEVPAYGLFVDGEIAKHGRNHPFVRTQFFSEEIDEQGGLFPPARRALVHGSHPWLDSPNPNKVYAFLVDIAGQDETTSTIFQDEVLKNSGRDSTALTIVEIDLSTLSDPLIALPRYLVVHRRLWTGAKHTEIYAQLRALIDLWQPRHIVIDATGLGAGLASFLEKTYPNQVLPFIFTQKSKSDLGWNFLSVIETGRYKEYLSQNPQGFERDIQKDFFRQLEFCQMEILVGPQKIMRWSVPDGTRDPSNGALLHDDLLISAALCSLLDNQTWGLAVSAIVPTHDPLAGLKEAF